jgi:hypothetical protein
MEQDKKSPYGKFAAMIGTSMVAMYALMYLNTYQLSHVRWSETRIYMTFIMGAAMAVIMLSFMQGMYKNKQLNTAIYVGSVVVFALALYLVRSQMTVQDESWMRAMIPHHSIAVMTSERAKIRDPGVQKIAHEIMAAQRREIAEMRYLIARLAEGEGTRNIFRDPPAAVGSIDDALGNTLISMLDPAPLSESEAAMALNTTAGCRFNRSPEIDPVLWVSREGTSGAIRLNGVIVALEGRSGEPGLVAPGVEVVVRTLPDDEADWRSNAELIFSLDVGLEIGYRGFYSCIPTEQSAMNGARPRTPIRAV